MAQVLTINGNIVLSGGGLVVDERPPIVPTYFVFDVPTQTITQWDLSLTTP